MERSADKDKRAAVQQAWSSSMQHARSACLVRAISSAVGKPASLVLRRRGARDFELSTLRVAD
eukprot:3344711-Alexandrium_andersonii.AAC.1